MLYVLAGLRGVCVTFILMVEMEKEGMGWTENNLFIYRAWNFQ